MILDTNALSAWSDGDDAALAVIYAAGRLVLPVIVIGEYLYGLTASMHRVEAEDWLAEVIATVEVAVISFESARVYSTARAALRDKGKPIPPNDLWIAALALEHRLPVLSRDAHFDVVDGLERIGW